MRKETFDYLIEKYIQNQCTDEEKQLVEQWYSLVGDTRQLPKSAGEWNELKGKMWHAITRRTRTFQLSQRNVFRSAAAILLLGVAAFLMVYFQHPDGLSVTDVFTSGDSVRFKNTTDSTETLTLPDGSRVQLYPDASLTYSASESLREVSLQGTAFFEVKKDSLHPFIVEANQTLTKVLGTSFLIKQAKGQPKVEVEVRSGLVSVVDKTAKQAKKQSGVLLTANQKAIYHEEEHLFELGLVEEPQPLVEITARQPQFIYNGISLNTVVGDMEKAYGIRILFEKEAIGQCLITGDLSGDSLYDKLLILSTILGINYEIRGTDILLSGQGCKYPQ